MKYLSKRDSLTTAWRALNSLDSTMEGWRVITVGVNKSCRILAGRHFPGREETVLLGFQSARMTETEAIEVNDVFRLQVLDHVPGLPRYQWVEVARLPDGSLERFTIMTTEIVDMLLSTDLESPDHIAGIFWKKISEWKDIILPKFKT